MRTAFQYYHKIESARGSLTGLPSWARSIVMLAALPGVLLIALSILAMGVSILALLLLTVPVYSLLRTLTRPAGEIVSDVRIDQGDVGGLRGYVGEETNDRKRIESRVIDADGIDGDRTS